MLACRADCSAGSATFTTVPSIKAMLEPRMVAARIQGPFVISGRPHEMARIAASSQGGLAMLAIIHSPPGVDRAKPRSPDPHRGLRGLSQDIPAAASKWLVGHK